MHFSEKVYNLEKATEQLELPLVVKSENVSQETTCSNRSLENTSRLPPDSISLLERKINISFAGLTVLGFGESNKADDVDEIYFFMYHSEVEDENYLFPLTYTGKCRLIHPPARSKRYVAVTELIEDLPWMVRVNDEVSMLDLENMSTQAIGAGTILEILGVNPAVGQSKIRSVVCQTSEKGNLILKEDMHINFTAVDDKAIYTLKELQDKNLLLPKCIEFLDVSKHDIVMSDDESGRYLDLMTKGPLKLNFFGTKEFILGWCPTSGDNVKNTTYNLALIPKQKWRREKIRVRSFGSEAEKAEYIRRYFPGSSDSQFMENKLFCVDDKDEPGIVYLRDRVSVADMEKLGLDKGHTDRRPPPIELEREPFPDSDVDDYEKVMPVVEKPPPLPPKGIHISTEVKREHVKPPGQWKELKSWIFGFSSRLGLDKVHSEIMHSHIVKKLRNTRTSSDFSPPSPQSPTTCPQQPLRWAQQTPPSPKAPSTNQPSTRHQPSPVRNRRLPALPIPKPETSPVPEYQHSISLEPPAATKPTVKRSKTTKEESQSASSYYYTGFIRKGATGEDTRKNQKKVFRASLGSRPPLPAPETPDINPASESDITYPYDYARTDQDSGIDVTEIDSVLREGQTANDFYDYSVEQVAFCFRKIALPDVARFCEKERIDGRFFKELFEEQIKAYFKFEQFHFIKVKKAIFDGWRPR